MAFKKILFLHNEESGNSRYFVAGNYDPEKHDLFDWYGDPERRAEYEALNLPSPSAFPTLVNTETGAYVRLPSNMDDALATLNGQPTAKERLEILEAAFLAQSLGL